jgi:hypothetical protein
VAGAQVARTDTDSSKPQGSIQVPGHRYSMDSSADCVQVVNAYRSRLTHRNEVYTKRAGAAHVRPEKKNYDAQDEVKQHELAHRGISLGTWHVACWASVCTAHSRGCTAVFLHRATTLKTRKTTEQVPSASAQGKQSYIHCSTTACSRPPGGLTLSHATQAFHD